MNSLIHDNRAWLWVWCPNCAEVKSVKLDVMHANPPMSETDAMDILCDSCAFVIATMHDNPRG